MEARLEEKTVQRVPGKHPPPPPRLVSYRKISAVYSRPRRERACRIELYSGLLRSATTSASLLPCASKIGDTPSDKNSSASMPDRMSTAGERGAPYRPRAAATARDRLRADASLRLYRSAVRRSLNLA
eukprot:scaffold28673_cov73-Isochrysis_galbana.AAC.1